MKKGAKIPSLVVNIVIPVLVFVIALVISVFVRSFLSSNYQYFRFEDQQIGIIATIIQGVVAALATFFILFQLRKSDELREQQNNIEQAKFILTLNQAFITNEKLAIVYGNLGRWEQGTHEIPFIVEDNADDHLLTVYYLEHLEELASLYDNKVLTLEYMDNLMAYRFFVAVNNSEVQRKHLFIWPDYYRGCFKLYKEWKRHRDEHDLPIVLRETALDKWMCFDMYAGDIAVGTVKPEKLNKSDEVAISDLIYDTDYDIYSDVFGNADCGGRENARLIIPELMRQKGSVFYCENIRVARKGGEIVGVIVFMSDNSFSLGIDKKRYAILPDSFDVADDLYFKDLAKEYEGISDFVYGLCICTRADRRREKIGAMLLHQMVKENRLKDIYIDIVADNTPCIKLCTNEKNGFGFEVTKTYLGYEKGGTQTLECITLRRPKDQPKC